MVVATGLGAGSLRCTCCATTHAEMKLHEYQAKQIFARFGVPIPKGKVVLKKEDVEATAKSLIAETGNEVVVVKAQIHAGGRGKGGGVKVAKGLAAAVEQGNKIFGMQLVTK